MSDGDKSRLSVMVIDDEPIASRTLKRILESEGYEVDAFTDPAEAIVTLGSKPYDIVVTDVVMGDIDGIQVLEAALAANGNAKVILITAFAMMELARRAMEKGAFDFVAKPVDAQAVKDVVSRAAAALSGHGE